MLDWLIIYTLIFTGCLKILQRANLVLRVCSEVDKSLFFAFIFTSIPAFYGYYVQGGALEVGRASTKAVVDSSITILIVNLVLTQIML